MNKFIALIITLLTVISFTVGMKNGMGGQELGYVVGGVIFYAFIIRGLLGKTINWGPVIVHKTPYNRTEVKVNIATNMIPWAVCCILAATTWN